MKASNILFCSDFQSGSGRHQKNDWNEWVSHRELSEFVQWCGSFRLLERDRCSSLETILSIQLDSNPVFGKGRGNWSGLGNKRNISLWITYIHFHLFFCWSNQDLKERKSSSIRFYVLIESNLKAWAEEHNLSSLLETGSFIITKIFYNRKILNIKPKLCIHYIQYIQIS